ncbi:hypothetical protein V9K67_04840 [Paraflavisolibacter sp. H34]|uniref:hypothetical protein n=1 Tax=Huijunlia imazamoxiresistens TaxID=3127457 RepID=UPI003018E80B
MKKESTDPQRNRPSEKGSHNDPNVRDYAAPRPNVSTVSDNDYRESNEKVTRTASENHPSSESDKYADRNFENIDEDDIQE